MAALQAVAIIALALIVYSVAWEAARYVWRDNHDRDPAVRTLFAVVAFVGAATLAVPVLIVFLIKYRTPWPVSGGKLVPPSAP